MTKCAAISSGLRLSAFSLLFALALDMPSAAQEDLPPIPNIAGKVLTVQGPVAPETLGTSLMHEHIFIDFKLALPWRPTPATEVEISRQPLVLANLHAVRAGNWSADNDFLGNFGVMYDEVSDFKKAGGGIIVDVGGIRLGRDPKALLKMSYATGLNIVMGGGWYQKRYHPLDMDKLSLEAMTARIVRDIAVGVDGTDIRSGIIGEVGINGAPLTPNELKSTRASARAARLTGAPISFHIGGRGEEKFTILDIVASEGVDLKRVTMGHSNGMALDIPFAKRVLATGATIEFDWLGAPGSPGGYLGASDDNKVAHGLAELVRLGYAGQIVLGQDVCTKIQLKKYGGMGFTYIHDYFLPKLRDLGVSEAAIHKIMVENPARQLSFAAPMPLAARGK